MAPSALNVELVELLRSSRRDCGVSNREYQNQELSERNGKSPFWRAVKKLWREKNIPLTVIEVISRPFDKALHFQIRWSWIHQHITCQNGRRHQVDLLVYTQTTCPTVQVMVTMENVHGREFERARNRVGNVCGPSKGKAPD